MKKNRTKFTKKEDVKRDWYVLDATGQILGRMSTKIATYLRGKHKAIYSPQADCGDFIVVINANKVRVTGNKAKDKIYFTHSGYPHGAKMLNWEKMMEKDPTKVIKLSVAGMLPKTKLGKQMIKKLRVYAGAEHKQKNVKLKKLEV